MSIFPALRSSSRRTCHNTGTKRRLILPFVRSFVFMRSDCERRGPREQETDGAVSFSRSKKKKNNREAGRGPFSASPADPENSRPPSCVSFLTRRFRVSSREEGGQGAPLVRKPFLKELRSALRIIDQGRMEGRQLRHSPSPPVPTWVIGSLTQEALGSHYPLLAADENGWGFREQAGDAAHQTPPSLSWKSGRQAISHNCHNTSVSAEHVQHINTRAFKQHSATCCA